MRIHLESVVRGAVVVAAAALLFAQIKVPAVGVDASASAVRGALGVSLENLSLGNDLGKLSFILNGGFALLSGALSCFAVSRRRSIPTRISAQFLWVLTRWLRST
jgi:hypothetical protein